MSKLTLSQIRDEVRLLIDEEADDSHFTNSELNDFINQAIGFSATQLEYPRDFTDIQVEEGVPAYTLPDDFIFLRTAYFGDKSLGNDVRPLTIVSEETLSAIRRSWLDETTANRGRPARLMMLDKQTVFLDPTPNADESVTGKKLIMDYIFHPGNLTSDSQEPNLPVPYHNLIQYYAAHLCYLGRLLNPQQASILRQKFNDETTLLKHIVEKETKGGLAWQWGFSDGINDDEAVRIIP